MKSLNVNKAKGPDGLSAKFVKMSANVIDCHLADIINNDIFLNKYSRYAKTATARPIYERFLHENLTNYVGTFLSKFISAYRKSYSLNHVLICYRKLEKIFRS